MIACSSTTHTLVARAPDDGPLSNTTERESMDVPPVEASAEPNASPVENLAAITTSASTSDDESERSDATQPRGRASIERPRALACVLMPEATLRGQHGEIPLRIRNDLPAFATVNGDQHGPLIVGVGAQASAVYELATRGMFVRAKVVPRDVALHPKREILFGGMVTTGSRVSLAWSSAQQGSIPVHWDLPEGFTLRGRRGVERDVSCGDLGTEFATFDVESTKSRTGIIELEANHPLDLAPEPNAAPAAHVLPTSSSRMFDQFETRGDQVRVGMLFGGQEAFLMGWAHRNALKLMHGGHGSGRSGSGRFTSITRFSGRMTAVAVCKTDVAIDAIVQKQRANIGRVIAGACIEVFSQKGDRSEIGVTKAPFRMATGASLDVATTDLAGCTIYPREKTPTPGDIPGGCR
jgi:hypothetical protein